MQEYPDLERIDKWEATLRGKQFTVWIDESKELNRYMICAGSEGNRFSIVLDKNKKPTREEAEQWFENDEGFRKHFSV